MVRAVDGGSVSIGGGNNSTYTVRSGDTLAEIANRNNISLDSLIKANPQIKNPSLIMPGQQINIPTAARTGSLGGLTVSRVAAPSEGPPSASTILREGSRGSAVRQLQDALRAKGFNPGPSDGVFGSRTEAALKAFQSSRGIPADGVYGPQTRAAFSRGANAPVDNTPKPKGNGSVSYNGKRVSDPVLRDKLEQIADLFGRNITVTSGDRDFVPKGGSKTSLHLAHRAVDLHVNGLTDAEVFAKLKSSGILNGGYEVIWHGTNTATGGPHIHIGRYGDGRASKFKIEGVPGRSPAGVYTSV
ncbi:MAG: SafA/ExsA family spore coat assembly protein [Acidobacteriota bacterium]